jgi:tRNA-(MS[2]IO[6]A)-hydroxylase (MiaE)-like
VYGTRVRTVHRHSRRPPLSTPETRTPVADPQAVVDLLGVLAYGELTAFDRLAEDARLAPTLAGRAALAGMAAAEIGHYERLRERLTELGADAEAAMRPFVAVFDGFHATTRPSTWLEGLVKAYVGDGIAADFYREVSQFLDASTRDLVLEVLADTGHADFAVREVRAAVAADPTQAGRLSLWARRLVGEALTQAQHVAAERDALAMLLVGGTGDLAGVAAMLKRITSAHTARMHTIGLSG